MASARPLTREQYVPRASTPLYDAIGRGILTLEASLAATPDAERPSQVIFVVVTDGQENASREFDRRRVSTLIEAKKGLGWEFVFLSADLDAFDDAHRMGIDAASIVMFDKSADSNRKLWAKTAEKVRNRRAGVAASIAYSEEEREDLRDPRP